MASRTIPKCTSNKVFFVAFSKIGVPVAGYGKNAYGESEDLNRQEGSWSYTNGYGEEGNVSMNVAVQEFLPAVQRYASKNGADRVPDPRGKTQLRQAPARLRQARLQARLQLSHLRDSDKL